MRPPAIVRASSLMPVHELVREAVAESWTIAHGGKLLLPRKATEGDVVRLGNTHGSTRLHVRLFAGCKRGVIVSEGLWDNADFLDGRGINTLTGDDSVAPFGGAAFHDARVWAERVGGERERVERAAEVQGVATC